MVQIIKEWKSGIHTTVPFIETWNSTILCNKPKKSYKITFFLHGLRKKMAPKFWSQGTHSGYLGSVSKDQVVIKYF